LSFKYTDLKPAFDIYLHPPCTSDDDARAVAEVVHSGWATPGGPWVARFEEKLQTYTGAPQVVALQSGTAALHLVLLALGIGEGDRVIVPAHTFIATASPVHYTGAVPVVVDSETDTLNISPRYLEQSLERLQKEGTPAKAVIVTHIYGLPARMDEILAIADRYKIPVIEDAAESVGSFYGKRHTGTLGAAGILSFNGNKTFTTAGGGALLLRDEQTARQVVNWPPMPKKICLITTIAGGATIINYRPFRPGWASANSKNTVASSNANASYIANTGKPLPICPCAS